jgi:hypothetical protein
MDIELVMFGTVIFFLVIQVYISAQILKELKRQK